MREHCQHCQIPKFLQSHLYQFTFFDTSQHFLILSKYFGKFDTFLHAMFCKNYKLTIFISINKSKGFIICICAGSGWKYSEQDQPTGHSSCTTWWQNWTPWGRSRGLCWWFPKWSGWQGQCHLCTWEAEPRHSTLYPSAATSAESAPGCILMVWQPGSCTPPGEQRPTKTSTTAFFSQ